MLLRHPRADRGSRSPAVSATRLWRARKSSRAFFPATVPTCGRTASSWFQSPARHTRSSGCDWRMRVTSSDCASNERTNARAPRNVGTRVSLLHGRTVPNTRSAPPDGKRIRAAADRSGSPCNGIAMLAHPVLIHMQTQRWPPTRSGAVVDATANVWLDEGAKS